MLKINKITKLTLVTAMCLFLFFSLSHAGGPKRIGYQGKVLESGVAVTGTRAVGFKIYKGSTTAWKQSPSNVQINDGVYKTELDLSTGFLGSNNIKTIFDDFSSNPCSLEVWFGASGETEFSACSVLTPKEVLLAIPFVLNIADSVILEDKVVWGVGGDSVSAADFPLEDAGDYYTTDNVEAALQDLGAYTLPEGTIEHATMRWDGTDWTESSVLKNDGENVTIAGTLFIWSSTILGDPTRDAGLYLNSHGDIYLDMDEDDDEADSFIIRNGGDNLVSSVDEYGNFYAEGNGEFYGDLTLVGSNRYIYSGNTFDIIGTSGIDVYIDYDSSDTEQSFFVKTKGGPGDVELFKVVQEGPVTVYRDLKVTPLSAEPSGAAGELYVKEVGGSADTMFFYDGSNWQKVHVGTGAGTPWTSAGNHLYPDNLSDSAGIGNNDPSMELDVTGNVAISGGIYDGTAFGDTDQVIIAEGDSNIRWADLQVPLDWNAAYESLSVHKEGSWDTVNLSA